MMRSKDLGLYSQRLLQIQSGGFTALLNSIPTPIAVWSSDQRWWTLNSEATRLTGFSGLALEQNPMLWIEHVHVQDRSKVLAAWARVRDGEDNAFCEYRFFPKHRQTEMFLREVCAPFPIRVDERRVVCSAYTQLSGLDGSEEMCRKEGKPHQPVEKIFRELTHAIENGLQTVIGEIELLGLPVTAPSEYQLILKEVGEISKNLRQANEYLYPARVPDAVVDPLSLLRDVQRDVVKELAGHGICVSMVCKEALPEVRVDAQRFRHAIRQVIDFSLVLLPHGGEVQLAAAQKTINGTKFVELSITSISKRSLGCKAEDVFQPFLRVNDQRVGLSMAVAQEILRRQRGNIMFRKEGEARGVFTVLMEACFR